MWVRVLVHVRVCACGQLFVVCSVLFCVLIVGQFLCVSMFLYGIYGVNGP